MIALNEKRKGGEEVGDRQGGGQPKRSKVERA